MTKHNRRYKDSVFVDLFAEDKTAKDNFLSLYNALHGTHLDSSTELKPLKLERAMYTKLSNDVSCLIDNKIIVLAEHQSTINENMPGKADFTASVTVQEKKQTCTCIFQRGFQRGVPFGSAGRREWVLGRERKPCSERGVLSLPKKPTCSENRGR